MNTPQNKVKPPQAPSLKPWLALTGLLIIGTFAFLKNQHSALPPLPAVSPEALAAKARKQDLAAISNPGAPLETLRAPLSRLATQKDLSALSRIIAEIERGDDRIKANYVTLLTSYNDPAAIATLKTLSNSKDAEVLRATVLALSLVSTDEKRALLKSIFQTSEFRVYAAKALYRSETDAKLKTQYLNEIAKDFKSHKRVELQIAAFQFLLPIAEQKDFLSAEVIRLLTHELGQAKPELLAEALRSLKVLCPAGSAKLIINSFNSTKSRELKSVALHELIFQKDKSISSFANSLKKTKPSNGVLASDFLHFQNALKNPEHLPRPCENNPTAKPNSHR